MSWVDIVVVLLAIAAAISGWRHGLAVAALSFLGVLGGALLGLKIAPALVGSFSDTTSKVVVSVLLVVVLVAIGETLGVYLGRAVRDRMRLQAVRTVDSTFGSVLQMITALIVAWLIALPLASSSTALSGALRESRVLSAVDSLMPAPVRQLPDELRALFNASGFPDVLSPFARTPVADAPAPNPELVKDPVVQRARASVLKIRGKAPSCQRALEGTGFVVDDERVMTNAHVVAGTDEVSVEVPSAGGGSTTRAARVVYYDDNVDVAVLAVPGLNARPLPVNFDNPAGTGDNVVALGYPLDGPFSSSPATIRQRIQLRGPNIYESQTVTRDVYTIRGSVRSGNSGGPLVNPQGQVVGVVFGAAVDQGDTGFVLTAEQVRRAVEAAPNATARVGTESCAA